MAYSYKNKKGDTYYLHGTERKTKSGGSYWLYYFAKEEKAEGQINELPAGRMVVERALRILLRHVSPLLVSFQGHKDLHSNIP